MPAIKNKNDRFHPFLLDRFKEKEILSGMPFEALNRNTLNLSHNINYFSSTKYENYPPDHESIHIELYKQYLELEFDAKNLPKNQLSFLLEDNFLFSSSTMAIDSIIKAFCEPNRHKIGIFSPTFPFYQYAAENYGVDVLDFGLKGANYEELPKVISDDRLRCVFIPNPNNPIGSYVNMENLVEWLNKEIIVVVDEAYIEFSNFSSYIPLIKKFENLIVLRTFSKIWGLAGLRAGVIISTPAVIESIKRVMIPFHFPRPVQELLKIELQFKENIINTKNLVKIEKSYMVEQLKLFAFIIHIFESEAPYIFVKMKDPIAFKAFLEQHDILIKSFNHLIEGGVRISIGNRTHTERFLKVCREYERKRV